MRGGLISAVNFSEVLYKAEFFDKRAIANAIIQTAELQIIPFDKHQAAIAANIALTAKGKGISMADRACLALGVVHKLRVLTGDHRWGELGLELQFDLFRLKAH